MAECSVLVAVMREVQGLYVHSRTTCCVFCRCAVAAAGTVSGVQASLQSAFEMLTFITATIVSRPPQFPWLMAASCAAVCAAACLFFSNAWQTAGGSRQEVLAALTGWFGRKLTPGQGDAPTHATLQLSMYSPVQGGSGRQS